jgi:hypothetical protein
MLFPSGSRAMGHRGTGQVICTCTAQWLEDHSVDVNIWMVNALLEFCVRHARLDMLDAALARLSKHGLRGNVVTYNWMLDACAVSECTQKVCEAMFRLRVPLSSTTHNDAISTSGGAHH